MEDRGDGSGESQRSDAAVVSSCINRTAQGAIFSREIKRSTRKDQPDVSARLESLLDTTQDFHLVSQLTGTLLHMKIVVLTGQDGCGKTTAALKLIDFAKSSLHLHADWASKETFRAALASRGAPCRILVLDDFLGHTSLDSYDEWRELIELLRNYSMLETLPFYILLITRSSVLDKAREAYGTDLALFVRKSNIITCSIDRKRMFESLIGTQISAPDFDSSPSIGFPLCCALALHVPDELRQLLFQYPRATLKAAFAKIICITRLAKPALGLLAVTDGYVDIVQLLETPKYLEILRVIGGEAPRESWLQDIVIFYRSTPGLVLVQDDFVSFANEAVREAALLTLIETHPEFVTRFCSLRLLSRLAAVTCDVIEQAGTIERPNFTEPGRKSIVERLRLELNRRNYRETLTSPMLTHISVGRDIIDHLVQAHSLSYFCLQRDTDGIYFIFWAGAFKAFFSRLSQIFKDMTEEYFNQALLACCYWGCVKELETLISLRPTAVEVVSGSIVNLFVGNGAEPNWSRMPFHRCDTPLTVAAWRGHGRVVKLLLDSGSRVNTEGIHGYTALMHFSARGSAKMVRKLVRRGAHVKLRAEHGMTAIHFATGRETWRAPMSLCFQGFAQIGNTLGETPLLMAASNGWGVAALRLLWTFPSVLTEDKRKKNCLQALCFHDDLSFLNFLKNSVSAPIFEISVLQFMQHLVMKPKKERLLRGLLACMAHFVSPIDYASLLRLACCFSDIVVIDELRRQSPLDDQAISRAHFSACKFGNTAAVRYLLNHGADPTFQNDKLTCLQAACQTFSQDCVELLLRHLRSNRIVQPLERPLHHALLHGRLEIAKMLLAYGANRNHRAPGGKTYLHTAALSNSARVLEWCSKNLPVRIDVGDHFLMTPFALACYQGKDRAARWLVDHGADVTVRCTRGRTCLHWAVLSGSTALVKVLASLGPPLLRNDVDEGGDTPLLLAFAKNYTEIVDILGVDRESLVHKNNRGKNCSNYAVDYQNHYLETKCRALLP